MRNSTGEPIINKLVKLRISIIEGTVNGSKVFIETHTQNTDASGLISLQIGKGNISYGVFSSINWGKAPYFMQLEVDFSGGNNFVDLGIEELLSVPYALFASKTDTTVLNLANRFGLKLNISDTANMLVNYKSALNIKVNNSDTASMLANYRTGINAKVNIADTANMLSNYKIGLNKKVNISDTSSMLAPYLRKAEANSGPETDPVFNVSISKGITGIDTAYWNRKVNISDTSFMLFNYRNSLNSKAPLNNPTFTGTVSGIDKNMVGLGNVDNVSDANKPISTATQTALNNKVNISDTSNMLSNYKTGLNSKVNISDTSDMLNPYLRKADAIGSVETDPVFNSSVAKGITGIDTAYWNRKVNISDTSNMLANYRTGLNEKVNIADTSNMLSNYRTGLNQKVNVSDTSTMLNPYLRKSDSIITDLQNQDKLLQSLSNVTDIDGNSYKTLKIGQQIWMAENLKTTKYRNGEAIPTALTDVAWANTTSGAYAIYNNDIANDAIYGKLYNWYAVNDSRGLCPTGWHVPSDDEWTVLIDQLGGLSVAGGKMKVKGTTYWNSPNTGATNESGFGALPGGNRDYLVGQFQEIKYLGYFWSSTELDQSIAKRPRLQNSDITVFRNQDPKRDGFSIRCLKDSEIDVKQSLNQKVNISDTSTMLNPYLRKVDAIVNVETDPVFNSSIAKGITGIDTAYWNRKTGNTIGNIQYWNGTTWVNLAPGLPGQVISMSSTGIPSWSGAAFPTLTTSSITSITSTFVNGGGNISSDGGAAISARGLVYGTSANPTLSNTVLTIGSGTGSFSGSITGLTPNTTYYIRAYATNSAGTGYGNEVSFQTLPVAVPTLITTDASGITQTTVTSGGTISNDGGATITERGIVYGTSSNPTTSNTKVTSGSGTGSFSVNVTALTPNTTYYIRSYAINSAGTGYGNNITFQTSVPAVPSLTTRELLNITNTTATGGGSITNDGGSSISAKGICWGTSPNPTTSDSKTTDGTGTTTFTSFITGLSANVTYYVRAYATNSTGTGYGNQQTFTTSSTSNTLPVVTSTSVTGLTTIQVTFNAEVNSQGGGTVTERGAVWNTSGNPTVNSNRVPSGAGTGVYTTTITGLSGGSNYYVRAYAINNFGISYGVEITFNTAFGLAILTTNNVIAQSTIASSGGNITDNGGSTVTARGVVWNTTGTPTISDSKTTDGSGTGSYVSSLTALSPSTTYYLRAYATNNTGTAYGNEQTFTTTALSPSLTDIDGNTYNTVQIGTQVWMSENLKTTRYRNGGSIPYVVGNTDWQALTTGAWSYYNHDEANNAVYGKLYNWYTTQGDTLCPAGWHVPSDGEWTTLTTYLGGESSSLPKLLKIGMNFWGNFPATNESGFSAVPGGIRFINFTGIGTGRAYFWTKSDFDIYDGITRLLAIDGLGMKSNSPKISGLSIRCIKNVKPILTTSNVRTQSTKSISGGDIINDGGSAVTARGVVWNTSGSPTLLDSKTIDGTGIGSFVSNLEGLIPNNTYYVRAYATNSEGTNYGNQQTFTTTQTVTDIDGNIYNSVQLGSQLWMSENLKTTKYRNGAYITNVVGNSDWISLTTGAWSYYDNDPLNNTVYGKLYNWYTTQGDTLCPIGWHVPSDTEWTVLTEYLGGENIAGGKMKSIGTTYWNSPNTGATNESGFSAFPGGFRSRFDGSYISIKNDAFFWIKTEISELDAHNRAIRFEGAQLIRTAVNFKKSNGLSVRCLKD